MSFTKAFLGNVALDDRASVSWTLRSGVDPYVGLFSVDITSGQALLPGGEESPWTLKCDASGRSLQISNLYVLGEAPRMDPWTLTVMVADARIWWVRRHVRRSFNIRRRSGSRRRVDDDGLTLAQVQGELDDITFRKSSTNGGIPYTAREAVKEVLNEVTRGRWSGDLDQFPQKEVSDLEIDDNGAVALARVLELLPGAGVFVNRQGITVIQNELDIEAETHVIENSGWPIEGQGIPAFVKLAQQRPKAVNVLLPVEQEVRFDATTGDPRRLPNNLLMENVYPCPDESLTVDAGRVVIRGEWVSATDMHAAWGITEEFIRKYWTSTLMEEKYGLLGKLQPDANWPARIATIRAHFRQTWRIPKNWMDRFESIRAQRCSVIDKESGTFGASPVWQDWALTPSANGMLFGPADQMFVQNMPDGVDPTEALGGSPTTSFRTVVLDGDLGIIAISPVADYQGNWGIMHPSAFVESGSSQKRKNIPVSLDGMREGKAGAALSLRENHRASTIITVAPASPNNKGRFYTIKVPFSEALTRLPKRSAAGLSGATGPEWDVRVSITSARFAWSHTLAGAIRKTFGAGAPEDFVPDRAATIKRLLCNAEEIQVFAETVAASLYSSMPDHYEGSKSVDMNQAIIPEGRIQSVTHTIEPDGAATTTIVSPGPVRAEDPMALVPDSVRNLILRKVQP